ncbi:hypothetical protein [Paramicrobacterium chengjingii]|uniref:Uncharacterized protein n=1 Tax=Paramicrobacterium chengjingii TaxID=2769067 RepID=A0ABX6YGI7_9MICO|nr:hypothetical protein [Microbacterium chengjingii]QPZ37720.1 hypothetical protein HCR76_12950 [Microbacterium chengjingii]
MTTSSMNDVDFDHETWIEVPIQFPSGPFVDAEQWVKGFSFQATDGLPGEAQLRERTERAARVVVGVHHRVASRKFWYFTREFGTETVAHSYIMEYDGVTSVEELLVGDAANYSFPRVVEHEAVDGKRIVSVAYTIPLQVDGDEALVAGSLRVARVEDEVLVIVDIVDTRTHMIGVVFEDAVALAGSLGVDPPV